jgi:O-6-methylguanine DNA methyltransferase
VVAGKPPFEAAPRPTGSPGCAAPIPSAKTTPATTSAPKEFHVKSADLAAAYPVAGSDLAALAGSPRAVRAVGTACATNPIPVIVPCHRVVRLDGAPGGYRGGPDAKRALLDLEGAA